MTQLELTLTKIAKLLNESNIPYMLIGGYSMVLHGCPRLTQDLDITLGVDVDCFDDVLQILNLDFETVVNAPKEFAEKTNVLLLRDRNTTIRVDLIFSFIDFERDAIINADTIIIEKVPIKNAKIENLIIYKLLAGRERDKEDVELLFQAHKSGINVKEISDSVLQLSTILQNDAYDVWLKIKKT